MSKKRAKLTIPPKTKETKLVPQELSDKWGSVTAVATACNCLDAGMYPHKYASVVRNSIAYLAKLHETLVDDALKHPQAHMIPELKDLLRQINEAKKEAKTNGKSSEAKAAIESVDPENTGEEATVYPAAGPLS